MGVQSTKEVEDRNYSIGGILRRLTHGVGVIIYTKDSLGFSEVGRMFEGWA